MKNLKLHRLITCDIPLVDGVSLFCIDSNLGDLHFYFYKDGTVYKVNKKENEVVADYSLSDLYPAGEVPDLVDMAYVCVINSIVMIFANGDIVKLENDMFELIGDVPSGLRAMEWSPDEELVVFVSGDDKAIIMTSSFDAISEVDIHQNEFGEKAFITVGWGKKETQFHGSEGKAAARVGNQALDTPAFDWDDLQPRVRWRGDGTLFAVSTINPDSRARQIRIFNRECVLQFTSEAVPGLENSLDWKPSGTLIASTQRLPNKHLIAFFEKNGLRHGEISLPFSPDEVKVKELNWNADSSVLAVWCEGLKEDSDICCLQLWASSNYNWQLKQVLHFPPGQRLLNFVWDKDKPICLHLLMGDSKYLEYQWKWCVDHSNGNTDGDAATVAVIDSGQVKITNFSEAVIPPPMCAYSLKLPASVNCIAFAQNSNAVCVALADNSVAIFSDVPGCSENVQGISVIVPQDGVGFAPKGSKLCPQKQCTLKLDGGIFVNECFATVPSGLHHWLWFSPTVLLCVAPAPCFSSVIIVLEISNNCLTVKNTVKISEPVLGMYPLPCGVDVAIFTESFYWCCEDPVNLCNLVPLRSQSGVFDKAPARCQQYSVIEVEGEMVVIGLTSVGQLFFNHNVAVKNCSSFYVHPEFLLFTTLQHQLLCIPRTKKSFDILKEQGIAGVVGTERQVERGARLVVAVPPLARVVLQMPRGNLEAVQPRSLAIHIVQRLLDQMKYAEAFDLMRRQRINLNIFYDHEPNAFLSNIQEFINQVKNPNWLCLFISDLMEADVTQTMYAGHYIHHAKSSTDNNLKKLDLVCGRMRKALDEVDGEGYLLPIITTFIKQSTADIGEALKCIRNAKLMEQQGKHLKVSSEEALNYLFYIVDVYELFDVALGLYDFDLVMMVAAKSQKDPKEYVPFLNELRKLEENYQKFTIDKHLKKNESALKHLSKCGEKHSDECLTFIKNHKLYQAALKIFPSSHSLYKQVCQNYAEYLIGEGKYEEAGILFSRSDLYKQAIDAFKKSGAWRSVFVLLPKLQLSDSDLRLFYKQFAHDLRERKQYIDAATIFGEYLNDIEEKVVCLCLARSWDEALTVTTSHNLSNMTDSLIKSGVSEHYNTIMTQLASWIEQLDQQTNRLIKVREEKLRKLEEEGDDMLALPECDMFSDTSSVMGSTQSRSSTASSRGTGKTYRSSKNKRKHERKLLSLKEGSPYEDLALVRALHELFSRAYHLREEIRSLNLVLLHFGMDHQASQVQAKLSALLTDMDAKQSIIWIPDLAQNRAAALRMGPDSTSNSLAAAGQPNLNVLTAAAELEPHLCLPPTKVNISWKLEFLL